ncbi:hypothetical protein ACLBXO_22250 [Methylobacterium sp. C33D]
MRQPWCHTHRRDNLMGVSPIGLEAIGLPNFKNFISAEGCMSSKYSDDQQINQGNNLTSLVEKREIFNEYQYRVKMEMLIKLISILIGALTGLLLVISSIYLTYVKIADATTTGLMIGSGVILLLFNTASAIGVNDRKEKSSARFDKFE